MFLSSNVFVWGYYKMSKTLWGNHDLQNLTFKEAVNEAKRCLSCAKPKCREGCPIDNDIPAFIKELANGNIGMASAVIAKKSNLPAVCGRVCPHEKQCEGSCILNAKQQPIRIGQLERFIADMDGELELTPIPPKKSKGKIAIIGSGPAGLTVAGDLAKMGFQVLVFEAQSEPGGVLMYGIPEFRLPKEVVRKEIHKIERLGVQFKTNTTIGDDLFIDTLFSEGFDAIFIGTGNAVAKTLDIAGKNLTGVLEATYLLQIVALANQGSVNIEEIPIKTDDYVIVIGAGNVAIDAARTAKREGAKKVSILCREKEGEFPALPSEIEAAKEEGISFYPQQNPLRFIGDKDEVSGVECTSLTSSENQNSPNLKKIFPANKIIVAIGQKPAARIVSTTKGLEISPEGYLKRGSTPFGMTTKRGVFSGGDVVHGPATVVKAMKDAKQVALGIAQYVEAKKLLEKCGLTIQD